METLWNILWNEESGQDLAEYALLIALIAIAVIGSVELLGGDIAGVFDSIAGTLGGAIGG